MSKPASALQLDFDALLAAQARKDAIERADVHADAEWRDMAYECVVTVARCFETFTTDEVLHEIANHPSITTHEPRALGPVMIRASRENIIAATDRFVKSDSVSRHRAPKQVWRSLLYKCLS